MKQQWLRRCAVCLAALTLCLGLTACGNPVEEAKAGFDEAMTALKSGTPAEVSKYFDAGKVDEFVKANEGLDGLSDAVFAALGKMSYTVASATEEDKRVKLEVEIDMVDYSAVMKQYVQKVMELVASPDYQAKLGSMDEAEYKAILSGQMVELLKQDSLPTTKAAKTVYMKKESGKWKVDDAGGEFIGSMFVNLSQAVSALIQ